MWYFRVKAVPGETQLLGHSRLADLTLHKTDIFSLFPNNERQEENTHTDHLVKLFAFSSGSRKSYLYISYKTVWVKPREKFCFKRCSS